MSQPQRVLLWILGVLAAIALVAGALYAPLLRAFSATPIFNAVILAVFAIGITANLRQVLRLQREVDWIEAYRRSSPERTLETPVLLAPMARMLSQGGRKPQTLSTQSMRSILDSIHLRLEEQRDLSRYLVGLLIFLGLLGTFWGLLGTINAVGNAVGDLSVDSSDPAALFGQLKAGLQAPLTGMGTAFSSSLFGLAGSLVLGFLALQASQAQNRFYNELEDWLSAQTRLSSGGPVGEGDQSVPAYIQALLEQTADSLDSLQRTMSRGEESRIQANSNFQQLADRLSTLTDQMRTEQQLMIKLAESQSEMRPLLTRLADLAASGGFGLDETSRHHLRNVDVHMTRLIEELNIGRQYTVQELRSEIRLLARTIAALAEEGER